MKIEELNPFLRYASMHHTYYPQKEHKICYDCRLFFIVQADGYLLINDQNFKIAPNLVIFLPPKTRYRFMLTNNNNIKMYALNFDLSDEFCFMPKSLGTATESTFNPQKVLNYELPQEFSEPIIQENGIPICAYITNCTELFLQKTTYYKEYASANLKLALLELLRKTRNEKKDYRLIQDIQTYIRNNYFNTELTNNEIAKQFNYHPFYLNRLMKIHVGKTLHDYLIDYRLHMAKILLCTTALNVTAIAEKTGFSSYTYFIKTFREKTGLPPLRFRKNNKTINF